MLLARDPAATRFSFLAALLLSFTTACSDDTDSDAAGPQDEPARDPGEGEWVPVPRDEVAEKCRLDPDLLDEIDRTLNLQWGIVRYGRLCHEFYPGGEAQITTPQENFSATKTLGAAVVGVAAYQTRDLPKNGRKTGPLSDMDRVDHWLGRYAPDLR